MPELQFRDTAAAGYDRSIGVMTRRVVPLLLRAARLAPGQRVLDIAAGTGLAGFRRVLRPEGRVAVSVFTRGDRALVGGLVRAAIARRDPVKAAEAAHFYSAGEERRLRGLFEGAGLREVETAVETLRFAYADFDDFFGGVERGEGAMGQEYTALPEDVRRAIREEVRRDVGDAGRPIEVEVEVRIASTRQ